MLSGAYGNAQLSDDFLWAAAELYVCTKHDQYQSYLLNHAGEFKNMSPFDWANVNGLAITSMAVHIQTLPQNLANTLRESLLS